MGPPGVWRFYIVWVPIEAGQDLQHARARYSLRRCAGKCGKTAKLRCGAVIFVQRFGDALNLMRFSQ